MEKKTKTKKGSCVYLVKYLGNKHPPNYIGSSSITKILSGKYLGSVSSKKWKKIVKKEQKKNPHLYSVEIIHTTKERTEATEIESKLQLEFDVVKSKLFWNEAIASPKGCFGTDRTGMKHTEESRRKIKDSWKNRDIFSCPHCCLKMTNVANGNRYHFDNCKLNPSNPSNSIGDSRTLYKGALYIKCPYCYKKLASKGNAMRYHFDNCKLNPSNPSNILGKVSPIKFRQIHVCPYCCKKISQTNPHQFHFENCLLNPNNLDNTIGVKSDLRKESITCPYCGQSGLKRYMEWSHFENCKNKSKED